MLIRRLGRWRTCIASYALVALAWPSLGPLPWIAAELVPHAHAAPPAGAAADVHDAAAERHHLDASAIPGSPTHPADHDCFECRVLKHLARCIPAALHVSFGPVVPLRHEMPQLAFAIRRTHITTFLPPVRAPPIAIA